MFHALKCLLSLLKRLFWRFLLHSSIVCTLELTLLCLLMMSSLWVLYYLTLHTLPYTILHPTCHYPTQPHLILHLLYFVLPFHACLALPYLTLPDLTCLSLLPGPCIFRKSTSVQKRAVRELRLMFDTTAYFDTEQITSILMVHDLRQFLLEYYLVHESNNNNYV